VVWELRVRLKDPNFLFPFLEEEALLFLEDEPLLFLEDEPLLFPLDEEPQFTTPWATKDWSAAFAVAMTSILLKLLFNGIVNVKVKVELCMPFWPWTSPPLEIAWQFFAVASTVIDSEEVEGS